jgi:hypothetical protein
MNALGAVPEQILCGEWQWCRQLTLLKQHPDARTARMFDRYQLAVLQQAQGRSPAVPLGPRQVGKHAGTPSCATDGAYLDLESREDRNKLSNVEQYLRARQDRLIVLAEVQRMMSHPVLGASWEGHVIESLLAVAPAGTVPSFHRSDANAEIDLLLTWPDGQHWAMKSNAAPRPRSSAAFTVPAKTSGPAGSG